MANDVSHAALPYPVKGARYTLAVPFLDGTGTPTDPVTPDTEFSLDASAFADCAEEVTTIGGSNGMGYITLTGAETNGSLLTLAFKVASGPKPTLAVLSPRVLPVAFSDTAVAGSSNSITFATLPAVADLLIGCIVKTTGGTGGGGTGGANNQARVITGYSAGQVATVTPAWEVIPDATTTAEILVTETSILRYVNNVLGDVLGNVAGNLLGNVNGGVLADLQGKVIGGGASTITGTGARVDVRAINNISTSPVTTVKAVQGLAVDGIVTTVTNQLTAAAIATGVWQDSTAGDFTTAGSIGKGLFTSGNVPGAANGLLIAGTNATTTFASTSVFNGNIIGNISGSVASVVGNIGGIVHGCDGDINGNLNGDVTGSIQTDLFGKVLGGGSSTIIGVGAKVDLQTIKTQAVTCAAGVIILASVGTATTDTAQSGDAFGRIGLAGVGLTNLGDTRVAHLDADISTRMATYTQPSGFLAATFPAAIASTTNITALGTDAISAASVSAAAANKMADHGRRRTQANVEASSDGDAVGLTSLYGFIQQAQESDTTTSAGKLTVFKTNGTTQLGQRNITSDPTAEPLTSVK